MSIINVLDLYVKDKFKEGNKLMTCELVDELCEKRDSNIHKLLLYFNEKKLNFYPVDEPRNLDDAVKLLRSSKELSVKYQYALYVLVFTHSITNEFVAGVFDRLEC